LKQVLIIEDEPAIAELQRDYLEIHGFRVDIEPSGAKGLDKVLNGAYDLVILDLMLPGLSGFEVCKKIREAKVDIPILIVSALKEDIDKIRGLGLGADDFMTKPFSPGELTARVQAHLSRYDRLVGLHSPMRENIQIRGLQIDKGARRVFVQRQEVALTAKEFELLLFLATNPNHVFSKAELFEKIWGMDSVGDVATVTVHIGKIREKIESDTSNPQYIETIWGAGYRFKA